MKKRKLELYITGKLMSALMVGRPAIFSTGGEMYHTAPVVKIHETETQEICLLTSSTRLAVSYISGKPPFRYCLSVKSPFTYIGTKIRENSHPKCKNLQKN